MDPQEPTAMPADESGAPTASPEGRPPIMNVIQDPPKKNRKKLIAGIIGVVAALIALVIGLVIYLTVFNKTPQRALEESVVHALMMHNAVSEGEMKVKTGGATVHAKITTSAADGNAETLLDVEVTSQQYGMRSASVKLPVTTMRLVGDAVYFKVENVRQLVEKFFEFGISQQSTVMDPDDYREERERALRQYEPMIKELEGQWLKMEMAQAAQTEEQRCFADVMREFRTDKSVRERVAKVYSKRPFVAVREDLGRRDGLHGVVVGVHEGNAREFIRGLAKELEDTALGKRMKECERDIEDSADQATDRAVDGKVTLWIDMARSEIRRVEMSIKNEEEGVRIRSDFTIRPGASPEIKAPSSAKDLQRVVERFMSGGQASSFEDEVAV